jgi:DNA-binding XRE family transcriptional regulator
VAGEVEARRLAGTLGTDVRTTRRRRRMSQSQLGARVGLSRSRVSEIELGEGSTLPLETWVQLGMALGRPFGGSFARDLIAEPADAGHLAGQELLLRIVHRTGRTGSFELPGMRVTPFSTDVGVRDDLARVLLMTEIWNRFDDLGKGARSTDQKLAEAEALAIAVGEGRPYRVASCWLLIDSAANRALVVRYSAILRTRFPGSSRAWVRALVDGAPIPERPGIAWLDVRGGRIVPIRWPSTESRGDCAGNGRSAVPMASSVA